MPAIFFGRVDIVAEIVDTILSGRHIALIGTGGMGKSSIAKAVLNEAAIISDFEPRLFITYDGIASSAMSYQLFLDRLSTALNIHKSDSTSILKRLDQFSALLVIDNAETFLEAADADSGRIAEMLDALGAQPTTRIVLTTRNHASVSANFLCKRLTITGISMDAACDAFSAVYHVEPINDAIKSIFTALDYHPLSINILANAASMNEWSLKDIEEAWSERQTGVLENANDKYRSLRAATEISIVSFKAKELVLRVLRTIAFLPQGIHRDDISTIFPSFPDASQHIESIRRSCLIYRNGGRLTMLAPVRMYISNQYNQNLSYDDETLWDIRAHYHNILSYEPNDFVEREHGNIDRLMHFDMTSSLYKSNINIHLLVLHKVDEFLFGTSVQPTSLWPLLLLEAQVDNSSNKMKSLAAAIAMCLTRMCWVEYWRFDYVEALLKLDIPEVYCRNHLSACSFSLIECLRLKGMILQEHGDLELATTALQEGSSIARGLQDSMQEATVNVTLADILLMQGEIVEAASLYLSAQTLYKAKEKHGLLIMLLLHQAYPAIFLSDFTNARLFLKSSMELDISHNGGRNSHLISIETASCEGWASDFPAAMKILQEATKVEVASDGPKYDPYTSAVKAKAYYEARMGKFDDARRLISHAIDLRSETGEDLWDNITFACIESFAGENESALSMLRPLIEDDAEEEDRHFRAITHRTLGEILLRLERREHEAKAQFSEAKTICDSTGMSPNHLYVNIYHWHSLPIEYDGWRKYLEEEI